MSYEKRKYLGSNDIVESMFRNILENMDKSIDDLMAIRKAPEEVKLGSILVHRFRQKNAEHVAVLKLSVLVSNLRAGRLLIDHGFVYEWMMVWRLLYETIEDVIFLVAEGRVESESNLHERFLAAFYAEDFDERARLTEKGVGAPTRREIRDFVEAFEREIHGGRLPDGQGLGTLTKGLYRVGSGFMHGRAASIMCLYDPKSTRMLTNGMDNDEYLKQQLESFWLVFLSAISCFAAVMGRVWGEKHRDKVFEIAREFGDIAGLKTSV